jgi:hypothetical protein
MCGMIRRVLNKKIREETKIKFCITNAIPPLTCSSGTCTLTENQDKWKLNLLGI